MDLTPAQLDRAIGAVVGSAVGDALGAGYEFTYPAQDLIPEMIGGGLGNFAPGEWTDDTAQAAAILSVICHHERGTHVLRRGEQLGRLQVASGFGQDALGVVDIRWDSFNTSPVDQELCGRRVVAPVMQVTLSQRPFSLSIENGGREATVATNGSDSELHAAGEARRILTFRWMRRPASLAIARRSTRNGEPITGLAAFFDRFLGLGEAVDRRV